MEAISVLALSLASTVSLAQVAPTLPPVAPPAGAAPAPPAAAPVPAPGMRIATGQAAVVGGNSAAARDRALEDAIKQAVDAAVTELFDPATRAAQAKAIKAVVARGRSFVPRYRTLEEGEVNGIYSIRLEAEVDEAALRAKLERPAAAAPGPATRTGPTQVAVLAGDRADASVAFASALASALGGAGIRARAADAAAPGEIASRVTAEVVDEGPLRGMARASLLCRGVARTQSPSTGSSSELTAAERAFVAAGAGERPESARAECAARLAATLVGRLRAALVASDAAAGPAGDLRPVTVDADVVEPAAIPALVRALRSVGAVSSVELTRVADGRAELKARTRASTATLSSALSRDAASVITLSDVDVSGDTIRLKARMRSVPVSPPFGGAGGASP